MGKEKYSIKGEETCNKKENRKRNAENKQIGHTH
jgi:hypothetical protein